MLLAFVVTQSWYCFGFDAVTLFMVHKGTHHARHGMVLRHSTPHALSRANYSQATNGRSTDNSGQALADLYCLLDGLPAISRTSQ